MQALCVSPATVPSLPLFTNVYPSYLLIRSHFKKDSFLKIVTSGCPVIPNLSLQSTLTRTSEVREFLESHEKRASMFLMDSGFMIASFDMRQVQPPAYPESRGDITVFGEVVANTFRNTVLRVGLLKDSQDFLYITCAEF